MFYNGNIYPVKIAEPALQEAVKEYVRQQLGESDSPLDNYDRLQDVLRSLLLTRFLVRHLVPSFDGKITEENKDIFIRMIQLRQSDPTREHVLEVAHSRRWHKEHNAEPVEDIVDGHD